MQNDPLYNRIMEQVTEMIEEAGGSSLPEVTADDNGDVLTVVSGEWAKAEPNIKKISLTINSDSELVREDDNTGVSFNQLYGLVESGYFIILHFIDNQDWELVEVFTSPLTFMLYNEGDHIIRAEFDNMDFIGSTLDSTLILD